MRHGKRLAAVVAACGVMGIGFVASAQGKADKVSICHGTGSDTNPYVLIRVDDNALAGHFGPETAGDRPRHHSDSLASEITECQDGGLGYE